MRIYSVLIAFVVALLVPSSVKAASITLDEGALDAIFGQPSFGSMPVDVRILPFQYVVNPALLTIETSAEMFSELFPLTPFASPVINAYFVDQMTDTACGGVVVNLWGCSQIGGNNFAVESGPAAGSRGTALVAHELGHSLSLSHVNDATRLMNPVISSSIVPLLSAAEVARILNSPFVLADPISTARYVQLGPVLITATAPVPVPESASPLIYTVAFAMAGLRRRMKYRSRCCGD